MGIRAPFLNFKTEENMGDTQKALNTLQETLTAKPEDLTSDPPFLMIDRMDMADKYLTEASKEVLTKSSQILPIQPVGTTDLYTAIYLSTTERCDQTEQGVEKLAKALNALSERGLIHSVLAPITSVELPVRPMELPSVGVFVFPIVDTNKLEEAGTICGDLRSQENMQIKENPSLYKELPKGQFYAEVRLSYALLATHNKSKEGLLIDRIDEYLKLLPNGTGLVSAVECSTEDLSLPYEVIFSNPLLASIKSVDLTYIRMAELVGDKLEQFNLLTGIKYTKRDGTTF
jgi:hypothetical protein